METLQLVNWSSERDEPDWAVKLYVTLAPVYYQNYALSYLAAAQIRNHLEKQVIGGSFFMSELTRDYLQETIFG